MDENTNNRGNVVRGGRGSAGEPTEIRESIAEARKEAVRIDHDLAKLKNDKDALLFTVADLRVKEKQSVDMELSDETEAIRKEIIKAEEKIDKINGVLHETSSPEDHKKIQKIVSEWYGEKRNWWNERARFKKAEKTLEKNPDDRHAQGDANRARAEMHVVSERLGEVATQAELAIKSEVAKPAQSEGIFFTYEQALLEREALAKRHKESTSEVAPEIAVEKEIIQEESPEEVVQEVTTLEQEPIYKAPEQAAPILFQNVEERMPVVKFLPDPEADDDLLPIVTEHAEMPVKHPQVSRPALSGFLKKILNFSSGIVTKSKAMPKEVVTGVPDIVATTEEPVQEIAKEEPQEEIVSPDEFLEKQLFTEFETSEQPSVGTTKEPSFQEETPVAVLAEPTPEETTPVPSAPQEILPDETVDIPTEEYVAGMPQEITPGNTAELTQIESQAEEVLRNDMDEIFGEKNGPFGIFGHTNGMDSKNWKDPRAGFGVKTVGEVMNANPSSPIVGGEVSFGIENPDKVEKMKKYLANVRYVSGLSLEANESTPLADFIRRGAIAKLSK